VERGFSFPRKERLKNKDDIQEVFRNANKVGAKGVISCPGVKLFTLRNGLPHNRVAFTFPRKYGTAVERNLSRRLSREAYRLLRNELRKGFDLVLLVYPGRDDFSTRKEQLRGLFSRADLLDPFFKRESSI
jgi:ribonuclease P protein component